MKILLVEDEDLIREFEVAYLKKAGYEVIEAKDGKEALDLWYKDKYDLVVLDLNLPYIDGITVCKKIRAKSQLPIIMVTARAEEIDELLGLEIGADDYIKKPFSPAVLTARVKVLLRRNEAHTITIEDLIINPETMMVTLKDKEVRLTVTQFNILYTLAKSPGVVFTRNQILDKAYTNDSLPPDILDRTIDAHIKSIRKALEKDHADPKYIVTVIGRGYKFAS